MFKKTLHAGSMGTALASVVAAAVAAELTLLGGAGGLIAAALSGTELFGSLAKEDQARARQMADGLEQALTASPLTLDRKKLVLQLMQAYPITDDDLAQGNQTPATIAANMKTRVEVSQAAKPHGDSALTDRVLTAYEAILTQTLAPITAAPAGMDPMQAAMLKELLKRSDQSGQSNRLRDEGITENAIIRLAQRISTETDNVGQAWTELQNAMDIAVRVQAEGQVKSNHGDFVDTVLARVAELAKDGDYTAAGAAIDDALTQADAQVIRLLTSGVEVALLDRDTAKAAALLVRKADVEAGGIAEIESLLTLQHCYYEIGRDKGRNLDSTLAIELAYLVLGRATKVDERGDAEDTLGNALAILGERENGTDRLGQAATAYNNALKLCPRDRVPISWATTQVNLANTLRILAERENKTIRLDQAVAAYREALKELTRESVPTEWATTQMNLGNTLADIGVREGDSERLVHAVAAYKESLKERARIAFPLKWAMTQMNLGTALKALGVRESDTDRLDQAIFAYTESLKENTRDLVPLEWAKTKFNLANVELAFFDLTSDQTHLDRATNYANSAQEVFVETQASHYIMMAVQQLANILSRRT